MPRCAPSIPRAWREAGKLLPEVDWCQDAYHALEGADAAVILTEWNEFRGLDLDRAREVMRQPLLIDLRNIFDPAQVAAAGFATPAIGRPVAATASRSRSEPAWPAATRSTRPCCASTTSAASSAARCIAADARAIGRAFGTMVRPPAAGASCSAATAG